MATEVKHLHVDDTTEVWVEWGIRGVSFLVGDCPGLAAAILTDPNEWGGKISLVNREDVLIWCDGTANAGEREARRRVLELAGEWLENAIRAQGSQPKHSSDPRGIYDRWVLHRADGSFVEGFRRDVIPHLAPGDRLEGWYY